MAALLAEQTDLPVRAVPLEAVTGAADDLVAALRDAVAAGAGILVADALTLDHIDRLAEAAVRVDGVTWLCVDPGPGDGRDGAGAGPRRRLRAAPRTSRSAGPPPT